MFRFAQSIGLVLGLAALAQADVQLVAPSSGDAEAGYGTFPAGDVIFDNIGPNGGYNTAGSSPASQFNSYSPWDAGAADDFTMDAAFFIENVYWVGSYFNPGPPGDITGFNIVIWPDADGVPGGGTPPGSPPDYSQALAFYDFANNANETDNGDGTFSYWADLPVPFETQPNTTYWLEVQPQMWFPPQWTFQVTFGAQGNHAVQGFDFLFLPFWTPIADPGDLAFHLTGTPVPEPATLLLLGCGVLALIRRRP